MGLFNWLSGMFGLEQESSLDTLQGFDATTDSITGQAWDDFAINPANGLPMIDGMGSVDVAGNPFGTRLSHDQLSLGSGSLFDDSWSSSSGGGFSDW